MISTSGERFPESAFVGSVNGFRNVSLTGSFGDIYLPQSRIAAQITVSLSTAGPSLTYISQVFTPSAVTFEATRQFSVGLGRTVQIVLRINAATPAISQRDLGPLVLRSKSGGTYAVQDGTSVYPSGWSFDFAGEYTLIGPTETKNGTFCIRRTIYLGNRNPAWDLDATSYPARAVLLGRQVMQWNSAFIPPLIDTTIDGVHVVISSGGEGWNFDAGVVLHRKASTAPSNDPIEAANTSRTMPSPVAPPHNSGDLATDVLAAPCPPRKTDLRTPAPPKATVFVSYSHTDQKWLNRLTTMLAPLLRTSPVDIWYDGKIKPSQKWREEIDMALESAKVGLLLVSKHFLASDFIVTNELPYLLNAASRRGVKILWVSVGPSLFDETALKDIQAINPPSRPWNKLRGGSLDDGLRKAALAVKEAVASALEN
jgi:hypothetical protein